MLSGCFSPSLVGQMKQQGITYQNTGKIVLTGSEADVGPNVKVEIEEQFLIQEIWDSICLSRPYGVWYASGYRRADFYTFPDRDPVATLWINASDASHLDGRSEARFRCPKIHALVMKLLQDEYDKNKKANQHMNRTQ
jgi:hypothetical protein